MVGGLSMNGYHECEYSVLKEFKYVDGKKTHIYQIRKILEEEINFPDASRFKDHIKRLKKDNPNEYIRLEKEYKSSFRPYISIEIGTEGSRHIYDMLLLYSVDVDEKLINSDWELISTDKTIKIKDLSFDSRVDGHIIEYGKNGMVTMH